MTLYNFKLLIDLLETVCFHLAQECFWLNPAKMPMPAEWVTVRRIRIRDSVGYVWWLSKTPWPKADTGRSSSPTARTWSGSTTRGSRGRSGLRGTTSSRASRSSSPSGSIPPNVVEEGFPLDLLKFGNNAANDRYTERCKEAGIRLHPARFPAALPEFFVKLLTEPEDLVLDPFTGSNTTGAVAEKLGRRWIAVESFEEYLKASMFRFD